MSFIRKSVNFIQIYGERNSGTNYLHFLLKENIKNVVVGYKFGWKHGFAKLDKIAEGNSQQNLIICITKDPYSWFVSMHKKPHHAPQMLQKTFSDFIRSEWACYEGENYDTRDLKKNPLLPEQEMLFERNPLTNERFKNIAELRTGKLKRTLAIKEVFNQIKFIRYEDLLDRPRISICDIAGEFRLKLKGPVKLSTGYFGKNPKASFDRKDYYLQKQYLEKYTSEDIAYVNRYLDPIVETQLGYQIIQEKEHKIT